MASRDNEDLSRIPEFDPSGIIFPTGKPEPIPVPGKKQEFDTTGYWGKMANATRAELEKASKGIEKITQGIVLKEIDKSGELLLQARQLIDKKKYTAALEVLNKLLKEQPGHPEALYLKALCYSHIDMGEKALETLQPLYAVSLERRIADAVRQLKSSISLKMIIAFLEMMKENQYSQAEKRLQRFIDLDPETMLYYAMLATVYMVQERLKEARDIILKGLNNCSPSELLLLESLRREIENRYLTQAMQPALRFYNAGQYGEARAELGRLEPDQKRQPLHLTFSRYLSALEGGIFRRSKSPSEVMPSGSREDVEAFHFFLVRSELNAGQKYMAEDEIQQAEETLGEGVLHAPHFPYINVLYGACIFHRVHDQIGGKNKPDLDTVLSEIERAAYHARKGLSDRQIEAAPKLVENIENLLKTLRNAQEEARLINSVIDEFKKIMDPAKGGVGSMSQLDAIVDKLKGLKNRASDVNRKVTSKQGKEALSQLVQAVNNNLEHIESEKKDAGPVNQLGKEFKRIMDSVPKGGVTPSKLKEVQAELSDLRDKIPSVRRRVTGTQSKEVLDKLDEAIVKHLKEIDSARESSPVSQLISEFNTIIGSIASGRTSPSDPYRVLKDLMELKTKIEGIRPVISNSQARMALDKMEEQIDQILRGVDRHRY
jgi:tetratricopeptide (TPR) repeat protein